MLSLKAAVSRLVFAAAIAAVATAQGGAAESSGLNLPPKAAPVTTIHVDSLPVVRSQGEIVEDFITGLVPGLMSSNRRVKGVSFLAVREDHVIVRKNFGTAKPDEAFDAGALSNLIATLAIVQQMEQGKIAGGYSLAPGVTVEQALTFQASADPLTITKAIEGVSGQAYAAYAGQHIFTPLKMRRSTLDTNGFRTSVTDIAQLMIALLNGGMAEGRVLKPATVDFLERTHYLAHPALPGFAYGFPEMRRNGWRALAHDGGVNGVEARLVIVPETKLGYFILVKGTAGAAFWRMLDNNLFDRMFSPHANAPPETLGIPSPSARLARVAEGVYGPAGDATTGATPLKTAGTRLTVNSRDDGSLVLAGVENGVLTPRDGGYWADDSGNLNAFYRNGELFMSSGNYTPLSFLLRWDMYLLLGLIAVFVTTGTVSYEYRGRRGVYIPSRVVLAAGGASFALLLAALLMWLLLPAV